MAKSEEVKGVTVKKKRAPVIPVADNPNNQHISKKEFIVNRKREQAIDAAGEEAKLQARIKFNKQNVDGTEDDDDDSGQDNALASLRKRLAKAEAQLAKKPASRAWKKNVKILTEQVEAAENEVSEQDED